MNRRESTEIIDLDFEFEKIRAHISEELTNTLILTDSFDLEERIISLDNVFNFLETNDEIFSEIEDLVLAVDDNVIDPNEAFCKIKEILQSRLYLTLSEFDRLDYPLDSDSDRDGDENDRGIILPKK